jgi:hypothetical protein
VATHVLFWRKSSYWAHSWPDHTSLHWLLLVFVLLALPLSLTSLSFWLWATVFWPKLRLPWVAYVNEGPQEKGPVQSLRDASQPLQALEVWLCFLCTPGEPGNASPPPLNPPPILPVHIKFHLLWHEYKRLSGLLCPDMVPPTFHSLCWHNVSQSTLRLQSSAGTSSSSRKSSQIPPVRSDPDAVAAFPPAHLAGW